MPDRMTDDRQWYEGTSDFLLWAPKVFLFMAVAIYLSHWNLYQPGRESLLRSAFLDRGYTVT